MFESYLDALNHALDLNAIQCCAITNDQSQLGQTTNELKLDDSCHTNYALGGFKIVRIGHRFDT